MGSISRSPVSSGPCVIQSQDPRHRSEAPHPSTHTHKHMYTCPCRGLKPIYKDAVGTTVPIATPGWWKREECKPQRHGIQINSPQSSSSGPAMPCEASALPALAGQGLPILLVRKAGRPPMCQELESRGCGRPPEGPTPPQPAFPMVGGEQVGGGPPGLALCFCICPTFTQLHLSSGVTPQ